MISCVFFRCAAGEHGLRVARAELIDERVEATALGCCGSERADETLGNVDRLVPPVLPVLKLVVDAHGAVGQPTGFFGEGSAHGGVEGGDVRENHGSRSEWLGLGSGCFLLAFHIVLSRFRNV